MTNSDIKYYHPRAFATLMGCCGINLLLACVNLLNKLYFNDWVVNYVVEMGYIGVMMFLIVSMVAWICLDSKHSRIQLAERRTQLDEDWRQSMERHHRSMERHHAEFAEEWATDNPPTKKEHFEEDLFKI